MAIFIHTCSSFYTMTCWMPHSFSQQSATCVWDYHWEKIPADENATEWSAAGGGLVFWRECTSCQEADPPGRLRIRQSQWWSTLIVVIVEPSRFYPGATNARKPGLIRTYLFWRKKISFVSIGFECAQYRSLKTSIARVTSIVYKWTSGANWISNNETDWSTKPTAIIHQQLN